MTKDRLLEILTENRNEFVSGEEIAEKLFMTRAAVWKAAAALKKDGHNIEAVRNRGYRLVVKEGLDRDFILSHINIPAGTEVFIYDEVESTNDEALRFARENPGKEALFISDRQTKGRGRRGRNFFSPGGTGIYLSFLVYPGGSFDDAAMFTCMSAVALCDAIEAAFSIKAGIKWVNDIFIDERKVAGILTEGIASVEDMSISHVVIGVGINVYNPGDGFPSDIKDTAGYILQKRGEGDERSKLCAEFINREYEGLKKQGYGFAKRYSDLSVLTGKYVRIEDFAVGTRKKYALVLGTDDRCRLLVRYEDGHEAALSSGEVSVKKY